MADIKEFIVNDRRKFTAEGEVRPDAPPSVPKPPRPETLQPHDDTESSRSSDRPLRAEGAPADPIAACTVAACTIAARRSVSRV